MQERVWVKEAEERETPLLVGTRLAPMRKKGRKRRGKRQPKEGGEDYKEKRKQPKKKEYSTFKRS